MFLDNSDPKMYGFKKICYFAMFKMICISNIFFKNNPDPNPDPNHSKLRSKYDLDPDPKLIISDPQHCF
jgi:hypothetical protein